MAITVTSILNKNHVVGDQRVMDFSFSLDGTYVTGGIPITAASVGLDVIDFVIFTPDSASGAGTDVAFIYGWDKVASKIMLFVTATANSATAFVELNNGTTVTTTGVDALFYGVD